MEPFYIKKALFLNTQYLQQILPGYTLHSGHKLDLVHLL